MVGGRPERNEGVAVDPQGGADAIEAPEEQPGLRVRVPYFPEYSEVRHLLRVWSGRPRTEVTSLRAAIIEMRGTRKAAVDWTDPGRWIPDRLRGRHRELAQAIWEESSESVNPRHVYGHWLLAQRYGLLREDGAGVLRTTNAGESFLAQPGGQVEAEIDESEGVSKLLSIIAENGPARSGGLVGEWSDYLRRRSAIRSESMTKDTMRRRLTNLLVRGLVKRKGTLYSVTPGGLARLREIGDEDAVETGVPQQIWALVRQNEKVVRERLRELLHEMDPFAFEYLVKRLLEEMGYQDVEVTARSGDGGVDVVGDIELGITSVREVVQAKRHRRTIQRKDLDALRGSLYRFNAVRGTLVTTARFSKGANEAAFATGVAPITLVDGDKMVDLLIEHGIGVRKHEMELIEVHGDTITSLDPESLD